MGPEGAVDIIFTKQIAAADDPAAARAEYAGAVRKTIDPFIAASWAMVDDIIDPADTRRVIIDALEGAATKRRRRAWRKHGVPPV
jgi:methylmalonyl-CoA carboxyltransferase large subunit